MAESDKLREELGLLRKRITKTERKADDLRLDLDKAKADIEELKKPKVEVPK